MFKKIAQTDINNGNYQRNGHILFGPLIFCIGRTFGNLLLKKHCKMYVPPNYWLIICIVINLKIICKRASIHIRHISYKRLSEWDNLHDSFISKVQRKKIDNSFHKVLSHIFQWFLKWRIIINLIVLYLGTVKSQPNS